MKDFARFVSFFATAMCGLNQAQLVLPSLHFLSEKFVLARDAALASTLMLLSYVPFYIPDARADSAEVLVNVGDCVANCGESATSIRITSLGIGGSVQGYSPISESINNSGQAVFSAVVNGAGVGSGIMAARILRRETNGNFTVLAAPGMPVNGIAGATLAVGASVFMSSPYKAFYEDGSLLFYAQLSIPGTSTVTRAYVCADGTNISALMYDGQEIQNSGGHTFFTLDSTPYPYLSRLGCAAAIRAREMSGTTLYGEGIWDVVAGQAPTMIGARYAQVPGFPNGVIFSQDYPRQPYENQNYRNVEYGATSSGYAMVHSYLEGTGIRRNPASDSFPLNNAALWLRSPNGQMTLVARRGDPVAGVPGAYLNILGARLFYAGSPGVAAWYQFQGWAVNSQGNYAFVSSLTDGTTDPISTINGSAIWSNRSGALRLEVRGYTRFVDESSGQEWELRSTGMPSNGQRGVYIDDSGTLYYGATGYLVGIDSINAVTPTRRLLIEHRLDGTRRVIAWEGQSIPSLNINRLGSELTYSFFVSNRPSVLFSSTAQFGGATPSSGSAVFMYRNNTLRSIGRIGDALSTLGGVSLDPYSVLTVFQATPLGQYTWDESSNGKAFAWGDDDARLKLIIDQQGYFPQNGDSRLSASSNTCRNRETNDVGDFLLYCNLGSAARLVAYHADSGPVQCTADFNNDATVSNDDLFAFLSAWFAENNAADIDGSNSITVQDVFSFLNSWFDGC